ncbi:MAG: DUF2029 domain-containing protein [Candidatus Aminicenantes bacterium]|nr:DUF2029 domain-containing protein [Candidatus Aminicenantes bacterium]
MDRFKLIGLILLLLLTIGICLHVALHKHPDNYQVYIHAVENVLYQNNPYATQPGKDFYKYSPLAVLMIYPFSRLIDEVGTFLFVFLQFLVFFWGFWRWAKIAGFDLGSSRGMMVLAFCSVILDTILSVQICQVNALLFGSMLLSAAYYREEKYVRAGLLLSLVTNLKLFPFTLALCFLLGLKKKYWLAFWSGLFMWFLLPAVFLGWGYNLELLKNWVKLMTWDQTRSLEMLDIGNFVGYHFGISQSIRNPLALGIGLLIGLGTLYLFRKKQHLLIDRYLVPVNGLYILLFSYLSESATSVLATTAIFLLAMQAWRAQKHAWFYWISWALALLLIPWFYSDGVPQAWTLWARAFHLKTIGYVLVSLVLGYIFYRHTHGKNLGTKLQAGPAT